VLKIGLIQMHVEESKEKNISKAEEMIKKAAASGANIVVLPEMFNCPYDNSYFRSYGEEEGGYTFGRISNIAEEENVYLIGGSVPELDTEGKVYNTSYIFDNKGNRIGKHRKMHLFDIDIEGGQYFKESDVLSRGNEVTVFETPYGKMGAAICFDIRFPELFRLMAQEGAKVIFVPGAFNMTTGPAHWELTFRTRALDNQAYTVGVAPARSLESSYTSYGNSLIANPWGSIVGRLGHEEGILVEDIDLNMVDKIRRELPLLNSLRSDIYRISR
jgi:omega-amidase